METLREKILREAKEKQNSVISGFFHEFRWLSNYEYCKFTYNGIEWPSTEHAYQAMKVADKGVAHEHGGGGEGSHAAEQEILGVVGEALRHILVS